MSVKEILQNVWAEKEAEQGAKFAAEQEAERALSPRLYELLHEMALANQSYIYYDRYM